MDNHNPGLSDSHIVIDSIEKLDMSLDNEGYLSKAGVSWH
jgi:hypothetical protein